MSTDTWNGSSADWSTAADWSNGAPPGTGDDAVIGGTSTYTVTISASEVANSLTIDDANATVELNGGTLNLGTSSNLGTLTLEPGSVIGFGSSGGTLQNALVQLLGGSFLTAPTGGGFVAETLNNVAIDGTFNVNGSITVDTALQVLNATGSAPGVINIAPPAGSSTTTLCGLYFAGSQSLDNVTINIGASPASAASVYLESEVGDVLTLGSGVTINVDGDAFIGGDSGRATTETIVDNGAVNLQSGANLSIVASFDDTSTTSGIVFASSNATLQLVDPTEFTGTISGLLGGGTIDYLCPFDDPGTQAKVEDSTLIIDDVNGEEVGSVALTLDPTGNDYSNLNFYVSPGAGPNGLTTIVASPNFLWAPPQNPQNGDFSVASNWNTGTAPGSLAAVYFAAGGGTPYTVSGNGSVLTISVSGNVTFTGDIAATGVVGQNQLVGLQIDGGSATFDGSQGGGQFTTSGVVDDEGETLAVVNNGSLTAGTVDISSGGTLSLTNGGTLEAPTIDISNGNLDLDSTAAIAAPPGETSDISLTGSIDATSGNVLLNSSIDFSGATTLTGSTNTSLTFRGSLSGSGPVSINGEEVILSEGAASDLTGGFSISNDGTLELTTLGAGGTGSIAYVSGSTGTLWIDGAALGSGGGSTTTLGNQVNGFQIGDTIDVGFAATTATLEPGNILDISGGAFSYNILVEGNYTGDVFTTSSDGHGGTDIQLGQASQTFVWTGAVGDSNFSTGGNWDVGGQVQANPPGPIDTAQVDLENGETQGTESFISGNGSVTELTLSDSNVDFTGNFSLSLLNISNSNAEFDGTVTVDAAPIDNYPGVAISISNSVLDFGGALTTNGIVDIGSGCQLDEVAGTTPAQDNTGLLTVTGAGFINVETDGWLYVGNLSSGACDVDGQINLNGGVLLDLDPVAVTLPRPIDADGDGDIQVAPGGSLTADVFGSGNLSINNGVPGILNSLLGGTVNLTYLDPPYTGNITIAAGTLEISATGANGSGTITFENDATLEIAAGVTLASTNTLLGFQANNNTIVLAGFGAAVSQTFVNNVLTLTNAGGQTETLYFDPNANYNGENIAYNANGDLTVASNLATTAPLTASVSAGAVSSIAGISIVDPGETGTVTEVLSDSSGLLSANTSGTGGGGTITGAGTTTLTIAGTLAQVNADLATLTYQAGAAGSDSIAVATSDDRGGSTDNTIAVTVNSQLATAAPTSVSGLAGTAIAVSGISVSDPGVSALDLTVALSDSAGLLSVNAGVSGGGGTITGEGTTALTMTGTVAQIDADLSTLSYQAGAAGSDVIDVATSDTTGASNTNQIDITIATQLATSAPASISGLAGTAIAVSGISVSDPGVTGPDVTVALSDSAGLLSVNASVAGGGGTIGGEGTTALTMTGTVAQIDAELATLSYQAGAAGSDVIDVVTSDTTGASNNNEINVTIKPVATGQTYILTKGPDTVNGGAGNNTIIAAGGTLSKGDMIDGGSGTNTLVLQGGGRFNLGLPTTLTNIEILDAQEGQAAGGGQPSIRQNVYLRNGLNLTVNVASGVAAAGDTAPLGITIHGADNSDTINLGSGADTVYLGSAAESVYGGGGKDIFVVSAATIGATIDGGTGSSTLRVLGGGTAVMGGNITQISEVVLEGPAAGQTQPAWDFTANSIAGLKIDVVGRGGTVTVGNTSQQVHTNVGDVTILANAATSGALITGGQGSDVLEIQGGGTAILNSDDSALKVLLDQSTDLTLGAAPGTIAIGSNGHDTITAGAGNQTLVGGAGDLLIGSAAGHDIFQGTATELNADTIENFIASTGRGLGDSIDLTNVAAAGASFRFAENASDTFGTLTVSEGARVLASIQLLGQYMAAGFNLQADGGGTAISYHEPAAPLALSGGELLTGSHYMHA
jgi:hypothetical protein